MMMMMIPRTLELADVGYECGGSEMDVFPLLFPKVL